MAKIKFKVERDAFDQTGFSEPAKPGVYAHKVVEINAGFSKNDDGQEDKSRPRLEVIYENIDPKAKTMGNDGGSALGSRVWDYVTFGKGTQWKLAQFLRAFGLGDENKTTGEFDTAKIAEKVTDVTPSGKKVTKETGHEGMKCKLRVRAGRNRDGDYRAEVGAILPFAQDDDDVTSDGFGEAEDAIEEDVVADEEESSEYTEDDLKALSVADLKGVVNAFKEAGFDLDVKGKKKSEVIAMILEAQQQALETASGSEDEEELIEDDEELIEDEESGYTEESLKAMPTDELKSVAKSLNVSLQGKKKSQVIAAILEAQAGDSEESTSDEEDDLPF